MDFLDAEFLQAMNEIGELGLRTYGPLPKSRAEHCNPARVTSEQNASHACNHFSDYLQGLPHDYFQTRRHQLAAVAFNAMMEFRFANLADEESK